MRQPITNFTGVAAPILRDNIDTDAIIPSREFTQVAKTGLSDALFADWRYHYEGTQRAGLKADFVLNDPIYEGASILLGGENFGCGSSREFAVWALVDFGIRAIIAPSFGSIFFRNCIGNGLLPIVANRPTVDRLATLVAEDPPQRKVTIQLDQTTVISPDGEHFHFSLAESSKEMLLNGWDPIDVTRQDGEAIRNFKRHDKIKRPWAYLPDSS